MYNRLSALGQTKRIMSFLFSNYRFLILEDEEEIIYYYRHHYKENELWNVNTINSICKGMPKKVLKKQKPVYDNRTAGYYLFRYNVIAKCHLKQVSQLHILFHTGTPFMPSFML